MRLKLVVAAMLLSFTSAAYADYFVAYRAYCVDVRNGSNRGDQTITVSSRKSCSDARASARRDRVHTRDICREADKNRKKKRGEWRWTQSCG